MGERRARKTAFGDRGLAAVVDDLLVEIGELYRSDGIPWVVGYSGGKDSTAVLQLVVNALALLPSSERCKPVHVISTDTLVENPVVAVWVDKSLARMRSFAEESGLPVIPHRLTPAIQDTFWVNLIGRGYPRPKPKFRWCTERMKIRPSNTFIRNVVRESGEAILVLGTRKAESAKRAGLMARREARRVRDRLSPNASLANSLVYTPVEDWSNDDVWLFLMQYPNPWGIDNKDLLGMYSGASEDGECPLVVDTSTPSCGDSRFGCWVCTLVDQDRSMAAMIQNDQEKEWMMPLLRIRNALDVKDDRPLRDYRRLRGNVQLFHDRPIPGPYTQSARQAWLRSVLEAQEWIRANGPEHVRQIDLVTLAELEEIRRIWVVDKREVEDDLPRIYEQTTGRTYPGPQMDEAPVFRSDEMALLRAACMEAGDHSLYPLAREMLDIEWRYRTKTRRAGLFDELDRALSRHSYDSEAEAVERLLRERKARDAAKERRYEQLALVPTEATPVPESQSTADKDRGRL
jgi:DNA sulfur modification protein DndC